MREKEIEKFLVDGVRKMGGVAFKLVSPGNAGVPDRLVVMPGGKIYFAELKTDKGTPTILQCRQMDRLFSLGCDVTLLQGREQVKKFLERLGNERKEGDAV